MHDLSGVQYTFSQKRGRDSTIWLKNDTRAMLQVLDAVSFQFSKLFSFGSDEDSHSKCEAKSTLGRFSARRLPPTTSNALQDIPSNSQGVQNVPNYSQGIQGMPTDSHGLDYDGSGAAPRGLNGRFPPYHPPTGHFQGIPLDNEYDL